MAIKPPTGGFIGIIMGMTNNRRLSFFIMKIYNQHNILNDYFKWWFFEINWRGLDLIKRLSIFSQVLSTYIVQNRIENSTAQRRDKLKDARDTIFLFTSRQIGEINNRAGNSPV
ncbi:hypothetical protein YA43_05235 [Enterobacter hormaechei subsp. steigerwaltii]|nr:hypothetical protein BFV68_09585 [Enterobacter hormaechei subsp. steigerwaltii]MBE3488321.1 hypothetical protein [Enterobacter cloacae complex sp. P8BA]PCP93082.1 hypothetical protein CP998_17280 [Enterobacter hormaechei]KLF85359.1 hypothetical protein YA43_05235 [Enterobacter hormaechei subsp. steigerwaltii]KTH00026.1 hypothetical protein ASV35_00735 [Enterobacter hormaechei subsp. steigerwaltii]